MKFVKYIIIVLVGIVISDFTISFAIEHLMKNRYDERFYSTFSSSAEVAIMGASRAAHHYVPQIISDSLHMTVANYGIDAQNIITHYAVLQSLLKNSLQKPKVVVLEIGAIDINDTPKWNTEKLNVLYPYFNSEDYIRTILKDVLPPTEYLILNLSGLYRHNSMLMRYIKPLLKQSSRGADGYSPLHKRWNRPIQFEEEHGDTIYPKKVEYFDKFISLCRKEGIYLIFAVSPNYKKLPEQQWEEKMRQIADANHIPLFYHERDPLFLAHREWFNEPFHMNDDGARVYSAQIGREIRKLLEKEENN